MTRISISEAAKRWGKSRSTMQKLVTSGQVEAVQVGQAKTLDISELVRLLGEPIHAQLVTTSQATSQVVSQVDIHVELELLRREILFLKDKLQQSEHREEKALELADKLASPTPPNWKYLLPWNKD